MPAAGGTERKHGQGWGQQEFESGYVIPVVANPLTHRMHKGVNTTMDEGHTMVAHALKADGFDASEDGTGRGTGDQGGDYVMQAFDITGTGPGVVNGGAETDVHTALRSRAPGHSEGSTTTVIQQNWGVRRLTPLECERLQGFPDGHTAVPYRGKPAADGPRYKALGNSMAVNCMRWIGRRIEMVDRVKRETT